MLRKIAKVHEYKLPISVKPQKNGGYLASCSVWTDCYAQGDTIDEAVLEIIAVAQTLIDLYKEENLPIPLKLQKERTENYLDITEFDQTLNLKRIPLEKHKKRLLLSSLIG